MKLEGRRTFAANTTVLWSILNNSTALEQVLPDCEAVEAIGPDEYRVKLHLRVGPFDDRFEGSLQFSAINPLLGFDFRADGESPNGMIDCRGRVSLEASGEESTELRYAAEVAVGGRLETLSGRLLETTARSFARRVLEGLERYVAMRTRIYTTSVDASSVDMTQAVTNPSGRAANQLHNLRRGIGIGSVILVLMLIVRWLDRRRANQVAQRVAQLLVATPAPDTAGDARPVIG